MESQKPKLGKDVKVNPKYLGFQMEKRKITRNIYNTTGKNN